ncbi:MAG: hypothetical protein HYV02_08720 [Deltaproteobacteria bacterium]|nr:hypothetical protein [Deltaproteobacteria bacterium]
MPLWRHNEAQLLVGQGTGSLRLGALHLERYASDPHHLPCDASVVHLAVPLAHLPLHAMFELVHLLLIFLSRGRDLRFHFQTPDFSQVTPETAVPLYQQWLVRLALFSRAMPSLYPMLTHAEPQAVSGYGRVLDALLDEIVTLADRRFRIPMVALGLDWHTMIHRFLRTIRPLVEVVLCVQRWSAHQGSLPEPIPHIATLMTALTEEILVHERMTHASPDRPPTMDVRTMGDLDVATSVYGPLPIATHVIVYETVVQYLDRLVELGARNLSLTGERLSPNRVRLTAGARDLLPTRHDEVTTPLLSLLRHALMRGRHDRADAIAVRTDQGTLEITLPLIPPS